MWPCGPFLGKAPPSLPLQEQVCLQLSSRSSHKRMNQCASGVTGIRSKANGRQAPTTHLLTADRRREKRDVICDGLGAAQYNLHREIPFFFFVVIGSHHQPSNPLFKLILFILLLLFFSIAIVIVVSSIHHQLLNKAPSSPHQTSLHTAPASLKRKLV